MHVHRTEQILSHFPAEIELDAFLFQLICVNKRPSQDLFSAIYFLFFVFPLNSVEVLSNASKHKKALMCLMEKIMC